MSQQEKHLKTWDEAILELGSFIQKSKAEEAKKAAEQAESVEEEKSSK
mgnify:CR=1 FL=1|nr:hypothetical protein [uncultured Cellulosilyticum sp.]